jgi:branched-chain amino acid transport system substrate-binding protein
MNRIGAIFVLLLGLVALPVPLSAAEPFTIGAALPFTGPAQFLGEAERKAMNMAVEEINAAGGVNGQELEVVYMDTKADVNTAMSVVQKLIYKEDVPVLITTDSNSALATMDLTEQNKVLHLSVARADMFTSKGYTYCFRNQPTNEMLMRAYMRDLAEKLETRKLAVLVANYPYGLSALDGLKKANKEFPGIEIVYANKYPMETTNFTPYLTKIKDSGADTIVTICVERHAISIVTKYKELGLHEEGIRLCGDDHLVEKAVLEAVGKKANGIFAQLVYHKSFNAEAQKFHAQFEEKFGTAPGSILNALGYANMYVLYHGLEKAGTNDDVDALARALRTIRYDSPLGTDLYFDDAGQLQGATGRLVQFVDGRVVMDPAEWISFE